MRYPTKRSGSLLRSGFALWVLVGPGAHPASAAGARTTQVLVAASQPAVTGLQVHPGEGETSLRFLTNGKLHAPAAVRLQDRFQVLMPGVDLSAVVGSWGIGTPEILEVRVSADETEGITVEAAPGVVCDPSLFEAGLEISCLAPPSETEEGGADGETPRGVAGAGEPRVSLDFRDADLRDVLRVLSEVSGLDFVLQPGVSGRVSVRLTEIPWDRALELILRSQRLGHVLEGGVLRVGPSAELAAEHGERRRQEEQRELAGELMTFTRNLAYVRPGRGQGTARKPVERERVAHRRPAHGDRPGGGRGESGSRDRIGAGRARHPGSRVEIEARIVLATGRLPEDSESSGAGPPARTDRQETAPVLSNRCGRDRRSHLIVLHG